MTSAAQIALESALGAAARRWWNADDIAVANGANVTSLADSSGNGAAMVPAASGGASQATYSAAGGPNGWPAVRLNGTGALTIVDAAISAFVSATAAEFCFGFFGSFDVVSVVTQHILNFTSTSNANPFVNLGVYVNGATQQWQFNERGDNNFNLAPNGRLGTSSTGNHSLIFTTYLSAGVRRGDIFVDNVSITGGAGFAAAMTGPASVGRFSLGAYVDLAGVVTASVAGYARRWGLIGISVNSTQRTAFHAFLTEAPGTAPVANITLKSYTLAAHGSSTMDGAGGLVTLTDRYIDVLQARHQFTLQRYSASFGLDVWMTLPIGTVNPSPFAAVNNSYSCTTVLAGNPNFIIYHVLTGRGYSAYQTHVTNGYVGTPDQYIDLLISKVKIVIDFYLAAGKQVLVNAFSQPSLTNSSDIDLWMGLRYRERMRRQFGALFFDLYPLFANADGSANPIWFIDPSNAHPNPAGHMRIADELSSVLWSFPNGKPELYAPQAALPPTFTGQVNVNWSSPFGAVKWGGQVNAAWVSPSGAVSWGAAGNLAWATPGNGSRPAFGAAGDLSWASRLSVADWGAAGDLAWSSRVFPATVDWGAQGNLAWSSGLQPVAIADWSTVAGLRNCFGIR